MFTTVLFNVTVGIWTQSLTTSCDKRDESNVKRKSSVHVVVDGGSVRFWVVSEVGIWGKIDIQS